MMCPALVLAAGFGTRLAAHTSEPKPLLPFRGRRLIEWNIAWLAGHGFREIWINLHHRPDAFRAVLGDGTRWGVVIRYAEEQEILGTAGAWRRLAGQWPGPSVVIYGDNVMRFDLSRLLAAHAAQSATCTIALYDAAQHAHTGIGGGRAMLAGDGRVRRFVEHRGAQAATGLINAGAYVLEGEVATRIPDGFSDFGSDVLPGLAADGAVHGHVIEADGFCLGLDTPECLRVAESLVAAGRIAL
jgi:mannose-1-phosphate guanylyltransferase